MRRLSKVYLNIEKGGNILYYHLPAQHTHLPFHIIFVQLVGFVLWD
jgi:hypothetical protein